MGKLAERVVSDQLASYFELHNLLPKYQSGFRKGHSTKTAILDLTDSFYLAMSRKELTALVLLDYSKAFDTLNYNILLDKMQKYGVREIEWFRSYLTGRIQQTKVNESLSENTLSV